MILEIWFISKLQNKKNHDWFFSNWKVIAMYVTAREKKYT